MHPLLFPLMSLMCHNRWESCWELWLQLKIHFWFTYKFELGKIRTWGFEKAAATRLDHGPWSRISEVLGISSIQHTPRSRLAWIPVFAIFYLYCGRYRLVVIQKKLTASTSYLSKARVLKVPEDRLYIFLILTESDPSSVPSFCVD